MDGNQAAESQTALRNRNEGWSAVWSRRHLGELERPNFGEWTRTFAIITTEANELVDNIHDRMPLILAPSDYERWLSDDPDPREFMQPFPASPMRMWPVSTRVNKPENDDPDIVEGLELEGSVCTSTQTIE
jgi:putative SOS response-associated peptidase YedK